MKLFLNSNAKINFKNSLDLLKNCESELMKNEHLFGDETFLSDLSEPIAMENDQFNFLDMNIDNELKDPNLLSKLVEPNLVVMAPNSTQLPQQQQQQQQPPSPPQPLAQPQPQQQQQQKQQKRQASVPDGQVPNQPKKLATHPASAPTVFASQYTLPQNVNFTLKSPVVTLAPVNTNQRQLLLPAKLIKSEAVVYPRGSQAVTSTPVPHQIHTFVNTANGTVLATGKFINSFINLYSIVYCMTRN